jgi:hypothetical protein
MRTMNLCRQLTGRTIGLPAPCGGEFFILMPYA